DPELYDIFEHEDIHVKGLHSMDILMFEILLIVCWYNPFVWLMRRAVRQNLEYLTDQQVLNKGVDRQTYQYSLLNVSKQGASLGLSNRFNFKFLKKRIMMMNKKKSSKLELSKYAFLLPIFIFSAGAFTISKADSRIAEAVEVARDFKLEVFKPDSREVKPKGSEEILEGITIATDTVKESVADRTPQIQVVGGTGDVEDHLWKLDSKADIDQSKDYLYVYDNQVISKAAFLQKDNSELYGLRLGSVKWMQLQFPNSPDKEGVVSALSKEGYDKRQEDAKKIVYVIDGVVQKEGKAALDVLDRNAIESVEVLKDASDQMAAYGENAKYGVIKITTKKENDGREGFKGDLSKGDDDEVVVVGYG